MITRSECPACAAPDLAMNGTTVFHDLPKQLDPISATTRLHVMSHVDHFLSGAAAFADVWNQIPVWRLAARIAAWPEKDIRRN